MNKFFVKFLIILMVFFVSPVRADEETCKGFIGTNDEIVLGIEFGIQFLDAKLTDREKFELKKLYKDKSKTELLFDPNLKNRPSIFKDVYVKSIKTIKGIENWQVKPFNSAGKQLSLEAQMKDGQLYIKAISIFNFASKGIAYNMLVFSTDLSMEDGHRYFIGIVLDHEIVRQSKQKYKGTPLVSYGICALPKVLEKKKANQAQFIKHAFKMKQYATLLPQTGFSNIIKSP